MDEQLIKQKQVEAGPVFKENEQKQFDVLQKPLEQEMIKPVNTTTFNKEEFEKALLDRMKNREAFVSTEITEINNKMNKLEEKIAAVDQELPLTSKTVTERCRQLLKNTASAIKLTYSNVHSNKLTSCRFAEAQLAVKNATKVVDDVSQKVEEGKTQHATIEELCNNIIHGVGFTYSKMYKDVSEAAKKYMKLEKSQRLDSVEYNELVAAVNKYVESRSKGGTKKKFFWSSGAKRMEWMKDLQNALQDKNVALEESTEEVELQQYSHKLKEESNKTEDFQDLELKINARVDLLAKIPHPEWVEAEKNKHQKNDCLYEIMKLYITDAKLEPDYVRKHKDEFDHYIKVINDVWSIVKGYDTKTKNKLEKDTGTNFYCKACEILKCYHDLENYVKCCRNFQDDEAKAIKANIQTWKRKDEYIGDANRFLDYELAIDECYERILKLFPLEKYQHSLVNEVLRFRTVVVPWKINEKGEPASEKDMAIYKENLRLFGTMFEGSQAEYLYVVDDKYKKYLKNETFTSGKITDLDYVREHITDLYTEMKTTLNYQNLMMARTEAEYAEAMDFVKKHFNSTVPENMDKIGTLSFAAGALVEQIINYTIGSQDKGYFVEADEEKSEIMRGIFNMNYEEACNNFKKE